MKPKIHPSSFRRALLAWYRRRARPLPWREQPSLYRTVVSEFMLQQTQVSTVLPYFERWHAEWADFAALAAASEARVLKLWEGLGYYSRARNLHRLARIVAAQAEFPRTVEAWLGLPGVGPYTAAAVTSIAFGARAACVDGNVVRVLARLTADGRKFPNGVTAARAFAPLAGRLLSPTDPGDHNQAMMELGATVCLRRHPLCGECPVRDFCAGAQSGSPEAYPRLASKTVERIAITRVWCEGGGSLLLHRAASGARRLADVHELPTAAQAGLAPGLAERNPLWAKKKRRITRFEVTESIRAVPPSLVVRGPELHWVPWRRMGAIVLSGPHRRWIEEISRSALRSAPSKPPLPPRTRAGRVRAPGDGAGARIR